MNNTTPSAAGLKPGQIQLVPGPHGPVECRVCVFELLPTLPRHLPARVEEGLNEAASALRHLAANGRRSAKDTTDENNKAESFNDALADTYAYNAEDAEEYLFLSGEPVAAALVDLIFLKAARDHIPATLRAQVDMQLKAIDAARRLAPLVPTAEQVRLHSMKQAALID